jgi:hypothetical protein
MDALLVRFGRCIEQQYLGHGQLGRADSRFFNDIQPHTVCGNTHRVHVHKHCVGTVAGDCKDAPQHSIFTQQKKIEEYDYKDFTSGVERTQAQLLSIRSVVADIYFHLDDKRSHICDFCHKINPQQLRKARQMLRKARF